MEYATVAEVPGTMQPGGPGQPKPGQAEPGQPKPGQAGAGRGYHQVRSTAIAVALMLSFAGIIALLIIAQPFTGAVGGCGGG